VASETPRKRTFDWNSHGMRGSAKISELNAPINRTFAATRCSGRGQRIDVKKVGTSLLQRDYVICLALPTSVLERNAARGLGKTSLFRVAPARSNQRRNRKFVSKKTAHPANT
jgi:hypothetical protein